MAPEIVAHSENFTGQFFKRWQQKIRYWLTSLSLFAVIEFDPPADDENEPTKTIDLVKFKERDYLCIDSILSYLFDKLYDIYCSAKSAKELWTSLEKKYGSKDTGLDKIIVANYFDYKTVERTSLIE